jgi:hypothetical protein
LRVFENGVLRRKYGPKREEVAGGWRRLHNEELHNLYASPDVIRMMKSRRMRGAGHVACIGGMRNLFKILSENLKRRDHAEDLCVGGKVILEYISGKLDGRLWTGCTWLRIGTSGGLLRRR